MMKEETQQPKALALICLEEIVKNLSPGTK